MKISRLLEISKLLVCVCVLILAPRAHAMFAFQNDEDQLRLKGTFVHNAETFTMRNVEPTDLENYTLIFGNAVAMEKYMNGIPRPADEIAKRHTRYLKCWQERDPWSSYLIFNEAQKFAGHVLLEEGDRENALEAELSYVFVPEFWGKGLGKASVKTLIEQVVIPLLAPTYPLKGHLIQQIFATARPDNGASCGVVEQNGFTLEYNDPKFGANRNFYIRSILPQ